MGIENKWHEATGKQGEQVSLKGSEDTWTNLGTEMLDFSGDKLTYSWQTKDDKGNLKVNSVSFNSVSGKPAPYGKGEVAAGPWGAIGFEPKGFEFNYSLEKQKDKGHGGIPEGLYSLKKSELQLWADVPSLNKMYSLTGRGGQWKGGPHSWGRQRLWLTAEQGTETYGRSGFTIHGGDLWGSAGCIDLGTVGMTMFTREIMSRMGEKVYLKVDYTIPQIKLKSLNTDTWQPTQ